MLFLILSYYYLTLGASIDVSPVSSIDKRSFKSNSCTDLTHRWTVEYHLELPYHNILLHLGGRASKYSLSREERGKQLYERWVWHPLLSFAEHRLPLFVCALLVPEYILAWAIRQYLRARRIANENKGDLDTLDENFWIC